MPDVSGGWHGLGASELLQPETMSAPNLIPRLCPAVTVLPTNILAWITSLTLSASEILSERYLNRLFSVLIA